MQFLNEASVLIFLKMHVTPQNFNYEALNQQAQNMITFLKKSESKKNAYFVRGVLAVLLSYPHDFKYEDTQESWVTAEHYAISGNEWTTFMAECAIIYFRSNMSKQPLNPFTLRNYFTEHQIALISPEMIDAKIKDFFTYFHAFLRDEGLSLKDLNKSQIECSILLGHYFLLQAKSQAQDSPSARFKKNAGNAYEIFSRNYRRFDAQTYDLMSVINASAQYHLISKDISQYLSTSSWVDNSDSDSDAATGANISKEFDKLNSPLQLSPINQSQSLMLATSNAAAPMSVQVMTDKLALQQYPHSKSLKPKGVITKPMHSYFLRNRVKTNKENIIQSAIKDKKLK